MKKFLASDLWLVYNFDDPSNRYQKFLSRGRDPFKRLIENVLLYDNIVIPTQDFLTLSVLIGVLGEDEVIELLNSKSISFLRVKGALAYLGNGGGVQSYLIGGGPNQPLNPFCAPMDEAISWAINGLSNKPKNKKLPQFVAEATTEFAISEVAQSVKHETYEDILKNSMLTSHFAIRNRELDRLVGIEPNQVRIFGGKDSALKGDEIDIVMALTNINLELRMMEITQCDDAITDNHIRFLLEAKAARTLRKSSNQSFTELKEIAGLPDIGEAVLQKKISIGKTLEIAKSDNGQKFREWFHENCRNDTLSTAKEYSSLLKTVPMVQKLPTRIIRFVFTNLVGFVNPAAGLGLGVADSFFMDKLFRGSSPKFFMEDLEKITKV